MAKQPELALDKVICAAAIKQDRSITQAVLDEILNPQFQAFKDALKDQEIDDDKEKRKIGNMTLNEFKDALDKANADALLENALKLDPNLSKKLHDIEVSGYRKIHEEFKDQYHDIQWDVKQDGTKVTKIVNESGKEVATLNESKVTKDGTTYRTINFPEKLDANGPMELSMALMDRNGHSIAKDKALYFTAHYNDVGNLVSISSPYPIKFKGAGEDAVAYVEKDGQEYTLPVTRKKYNDMKQEVSKNKVDHKEKEAHDKKIEKDKPKPKPEPAFAIEGGGLKPKTTWLIEAEPVRVVRQEESKKIAKKIRSALETKQKEPMHSKTAGDLAVAQGRSSTKAKDEKNLGR